MVKFDLNFIDKESGHFLSKKCANVEEALKFIEDNNDNLTYYTLWQIDSKIIAESKIIKR